jgi:ABC-type polysaccharide/polyol phosphate export permease
MVFSSIFKKWRDFWLRVSPNFFGELFTCMICLPTWIGMILSYLGISVIDTYFQVPGFLTIILDGFIASGSVWLVHSLQEKLEK